MSTNPLPKLKQKDMYDINCPYCDAPQDINHDDGQGYKEGVLHNQECGACDKIFTFTTAVIYHYSVFKADCLNGAAHDFRPTKTFPKEFTEMECKTCEERRKCTPEEMAAILHPVAV